MAVLPYEAGALYKAKDWVSLHEIKRITNADHMASSNGGGMIENPPSIYDFFSPTGFIESRRVVRGTMNISEEIQFVSASFETGNSYGTSGGLKPDHVRIKLFKLVEIEIGVDVFIKGFDKVM